MVIQNYLNGNLCEQHLFNICSLLGMFYTKLGSMESYSIEEFVKRYNLQDYISLIEVNGTKFARLTKKGRIVKKMKYLVRYLQRTIIGSSALTTEPLELQNVHLTLNLGNKEILTTHVDTSNLPFLRRYISEQNHELDKNVSKYFIYIVYDSNMDAIVKVLTKEGQDYLKTIRELLKLEEKL